MVFKQQHCLRILHVVGGMNRGGIETWLMHILRHIDRDRYQMDFLVHTSEPCAYDDEIRALGSKVIPCLNSSRPWLYAHNFQRILNECGPYNIVHSHVHHFSGFVLRLAEKSGVPVRIAHCHNNSSPVEANANLQRRFYLNLMKALIKRHASLGLGCSQLAAADLFGSDWKVDPKWQLFYCGIDILPFQQPIDALKIRTQLSIPTNAFVIGHVGRFQEQKNHQFLLKIFAEVANRESQVYLLLLGEGPLRANIEQQALQMGISDRVIFAGSRSDIPQLMMGAMDVLLLPSLHEGLPIVGIEAQTARLPLIMSDVITDEFHKIEPLVIKIALSQPVEVWANAVLAARNKRSKVATAECLTAMLNSEFNITNCIKILTKTYADQCC
jgi:glycosyltransferase involved in cell wall biosynthesis